MWRDQSNIIVYDTNNYRTCNIKFLYLKENMDTTIIEINKMFTQRMELKNKYKNYIQKMWPSLINSYNGCHIRTWGYFNDFKDFITRERFNKTVTTFNLEKVKRTVLKFVNANNKQLYLSTESIKLKTILKDFFERRLLILLSNMISVSHSRVTNETLGLDVIIDIEILGRADDLLLSADSSFSKTVFFRNSNCLKNRCKSFRTLDKSLYVATNIIKK